MSLADKSLLFFVSGAHELAIYCEAGDLPRAGDLLAMYCEAGWCSFTRLVVRVSTAILRVSTAILRIEAQLCCILSHILDLRIETQLRDRVLPRRYYGLISLFFSWRARARVIREICICH